MNKRTIIAYLACAILACGGCSTTVQVSSDINSYTDQISALKHKLDINPENAEAIRDLGIIYFQVNQYLRADSLLSKSISIDPNDSKALFYHGMTYEALGDTSAALSAYINYSDFTIFSTYRRLMEGRYRALSDRVIHTQLSDLIQHEQSLTTNDVTPGTIAVFPMDYTGVDQRYAPLGKGIAELLIVDLGQVTALRPVERIRISALLNELKFGTTKYVDPATAPRMGKFLRAAELVTGTYSVSGESSLRMDAQSVKITGEHVGAPVSEDGALDDLFRMEKHMVYSLLDRLGITPTPLERKRIDPVPTENIEAFLLYCIGLEREDERDFRSAMVYFQQASKMDPQFALARDAALTMESIVLTGGSSESALLAAYNADPPISGGGGGKSTGLVVQRLQKMGATTGTTILPGSESRAPEQEAVRAGATILHLPEPPPPPAK